MAKVVISIPVHEQAGVVENQLQNIQHFIPNGAVVLHVSGDSPSSFLQEIRALAKKMDGFAFVNPATYHTHAAHEAGQVTGLSTVHASNFVFADSVVKFDTFAIDTSNDMFVRTGIESLFDQFACGFHVSHTDPTDYPFKDVIRDIAPFVEVKTMEKGSQEGSFYPRHVFKEVAQIIQKIPGFVKAEEMYLPSLAFNLFPELYQQNSGEHYVYHNPAHYAVTRHDIHEVQYGNYGPRYGVKRVPRSLNDETRQYISKITGLDV